MQQLLKLYTSGTIKDVLLFVMDTIVYGAIFRPWNVFTLVQIIFILIILIQKGYAQLAHLYAKLVQHSMTARVVYHPLC